jgi:exonuclease III
VDNALLQPQPRAMYAEVLAEGWTDFIAKCFPDRPPFTFWDYRRKRWERDAGLRIDHILVNPLFKIAAAGVDKTNAARKTLVTTRRCGQSSSS